MLPHREATKEFVFNVGCCVEGVEHGNKLDPEGRTCKTTMGTPQDVIKVFS